MAKRQGLALFFSYGVSLATWARLGFLDREAAYYRKLAEMMERVAFVTYGGQEDEALAQQITGIEVWNNRWGLSPHRFALEAGWRYRDRLRRMKIVKTNQLSAAWAALPTKWLCGASLVVRCGYLPSRFRRQAGAPRLTQARLWCQEAAVFSAADHALVSSQGDADYLTRAYRLPQAKITVIPNFVQTDVFAPLEEVQPQPGLVGFVGRLTEQKNPLALVEAAAGMPGIRLRVIGSGHLRETLEARARELQVHVEFLAGVPHADLPRYLGECQAFAFPSLYEGHPKALLEAMACGLPVITTPVAGIRSLIRHRETGYLCAAPSAGAIREGLQTVLGDAPLRQHLGEQARRFVVEQFALERVLVREIAAYREMGVL